MRKTRIAAAVVLSSTMALVWSAPGASSQESDRTVGVRDQCDPVTFNAVLGDGACVGDGKVTFGEFIAALNPQDFGHKGWRNQPYETRIEPDEVLAAVSRGGEFHTFTEVPAFGPGCVPELNEPVGLTGPPATDCDAAFAHTAMPPGARLRVGRLSRGKHLFMCMIHPWMRTTVVVRAD